MGNNASEEFVSDDDIKTAELIPIPSDPKGSKMTNDLVIRKAGNSGLYTDDDFTSGRNSVYCYPVPPTEWDVIKWMRPSEISEHPTLVGDGFSCEDVDQGELGDCWFLSAMAAVSQSAKFMNKIVPPGQSVSGPKYTGKFHFRFWRYGSWVDVIVDDYLPTWNGGLIFCRSTAANKFWAPLLEKAYAKLHYSYQAIEGGFAEAAMEDLTGGIAAYYSLGSKTPPSLFRILHKGLRNGSFVCANIVHEKWTQYREKELKKKHGLLNGHAYTMLQAVKVKDTKGNQVELVKIRNPWGGSIEWTGDWSDLYINKAWRNLEKETQDKLGEPKQDNGEWWMSFAEFIQYFSHLTVCTVGPDFHEDGATTGDSWKLSSVEGEWVPEKSAGGCSNDLQFYSTNPQYFLGLKKADDFNTKEDKPSDKGKCAVVIGLMQEYRKVERAEGMKNLCLHLNVYKLERKTKKRLDHSFFVRKQIVANSGNYTNLREVKITAELQPGNYVIVPSTFNPGEKGSFLIRIFTEKKVGLTELL